MDFSDLQLELHLIIKEAVEMTDSELILNAICNADTYKCKHMNRLLDEYDYQDTLPHTVRKNFEWFYVLTEGRLAVQI